jgi:hypothetical protein
MLAYRLVAIILFFVSLASADLICRCQDNAALCVTSADCNSNVACACQDEAPIILNLVNSDSSSVVEPQPVVDPQIVPASDAKFAGIAIGLGAAVVALVAFTVWLGYCTRRQ